VRCWPFAFALAWAGGAALITLVWRMGAPRPRVDVSAAPAEGPMIVLGRTSGSATRPAPSGAEAAAWVASVKILSPHGIPMDACLEISADRLFVTDGRTRLQIDETFLLPADWRPYVRIDGVPPPTPSVPSALAARCPYGASEGARYSETLLPNDVAVEVSGCRVGSRIVPCRDGDDAITTSQYSGGGLFARRRYDPPVLFRRLGAWTALALGLVGAFLLRKARGVLPVRP
jgi:hypothetical protein